MRRAATRQLLVTALVVTIVQRRQRNPTPKDSSWWRAICLQHLLEHKASDSLNDCFQGCHRQRILRDPASVPFVCELEQIQQGSVEAIAFSHLLPLSWRLMPRGSM